MASITLVDLANLADLGNAEVKPRVGVY